MKDWLRRLIKCRLLSLCGGMIDVDDKGVYWKCARCGKVTR